jgi:ABC-type nitrate/sulfonate/bicarbonate transport system substrate-binding protein
LPLAQPFHDEVRSVSVNLLCLKAVGLCSILPSIAQRQGLFKKHGVEVELIPVSGTQIPEPTISSPLGYIGAPAAVMRAAGGADLKVLACFDTARLSSCLVVNPGIRKPEQLRGKKLGARATGAAIWIHTILALEQLGLDRERDQVNIVEIGDPVEIIGALEAGWIDGAVLSRPQCEQLTNKGYLVLCDLFPLHLHGAPDALVATARFLRDRPKVVERIIAGLVEAAAFTLSPRQRPAALAAMKAELMISDDVAAEIGLLELAKVVVRTPYPAVDRLCDMQRIMSASRPTVSRVSIKDLIYDHLVHKLDEDGSIDRIYASYAAV